MTYNIKMSDTGKPVIPENIDDLIFKSVPTVSIRKRISLNITTSTINGTGYNTYLHDFGYIPQVIAFVTTADYTDQPSRYINVPNNWQTTNVSGGSDPGTYFNSLEQFDCYTDDSILVVSAHNDVNDGSDLIEYFAYTYTFNILILMEEALIS